MIIAIDTGGTFTDIVMAIGGHALVLKVASTPDDPARAAIEGLGAIGSLSGQPLSSALLIHGSTVATNALLERKGARVALITNFGFEDVIEIGRQNRPHLYAMTSVRPEPLVARADRVGITGRLDQNGHDLEPLRSSEISALAERLRDVSAVAICMLHSYANPAHEIAVANALSGAGIQHISRSSAILPEYREYERTATTVVNAYVTPIMQGYLQRLESECGVRSIRIMGSGGGALSVRHAREEPVHTVLSGPAGGVAGALAVARAAGFEDIITFDMGGTSTDVSLCPGRPLHTREFSIAGMPVAVPMLDIHTVGAGGGSIAWVDAGGALRVGPRSAGALPGPICYGRGGREVTVTDANVWLGRLPPRAFLGGGQELHREPIEDALDQIAKSLGTTSDAAAAGILSVVNSTMEGALRVISVEKGYDPAQFTLVAFGGAAGLHAADLASSLGIPRVLLPPHPGVLSALGMLVSPIRKATARTVLLRADDEPAIDAAFIELERRVVKEMTEDGIATSQFTITRSIDARYAGQSHELRVPAENWIDALHRAHEQRYGFSNRKSIAEAVTLRVEAATTAPPLPLLEMKTVHSVDGPERVYCGDGWSRIPVIGRSARMEAVRGPAIIAEYSSTTWIPRGWVVRVVEGGSLIMEREV